MAQGIAPFFLGSIFSDLPFSAVLSLSLALIIDPTIRYYTVPSGRPKRLSCS
jgi:hypothetical protein